SGMEMTFFFQAEDGIRDRTVTGVQTCALPISRQDAAPIRRSPWPRPARSERREQDVRAGEAAVCPARIRRQADPGVRCDPDERRSEERRVGKSGGVGGGGLMQSKKR